MVGGYFAVGLVSYAAGHRVTVVDRHGLADPIAARLEWRPEMGPAGRVWPVRYRAGHEKGLPLAWIVARYADLRSPIGRRLARRPAVAQANRVLGCSRLHELLRAVDAPLTFDRFFSNIGVAWRLRSFRPLPREEVAAGVAVEILCLPLLPHRRRTPSPPPPTRPRRRAASNPASTILYLRKDIAQPMRRSMTATIMRLPSSS